MNDVQHYNGWLRLNNGFDVELVHGIPAILSDNGLDDQHDEGDLVEQVKTLSGLRTTILGWHERDASRHEHETALCVDAMQFEEVLKRLAMSAAALFVERYQTPVNGHAVDFDRQQYDRDFNRALEHCCLDPADYNKQDYFELYQQTLHRESERLVALNIYPEVEAE